MFVTNTTIIANRWRRQFYQFYSRWCKLYDNVIFLLEKTATPSCNYILKLQNEVFQNISKLALQIGSLLLSKVGQNMNNLYFKSQVIWSGQSEDIEKKLERPSHFHSIQKHWNMKHFFYFFYLKSRLKSDTFSHIKHIVIIVHGPGDIATFLKSSCFGKVDVDLARILWIIWLMLRKYWVGCACNYLFCLWIKCCCILNYNRSINS